MAPSFEPPPDAAQRMQDSDLALVSSQTQQNRTSNASGISELSAVTANQAQPIDPTDSQILNYNEWSLGIPNQLQDINALHHSSMFNAPEVNHEFNLLNNFLSDSLNDDGGMYAGDEARGNFTGDPTALGIGPSNAAGQVPGVALAPTQAPNNQAQQLPANPSSTATAQGNQIPRPTSTAPNDKARETYYMTAADPSGNESAEERMNKLLKAKYDAGLLRPFNYVQGYARLSKYMEKHMQPLSRQKILRQLERFRPKFRERMQKLTDVELIRVEMWFERTLMEYDRVFASMAIPACCWRRTGEIFRGNKEMAELVQVPINSLRDGKLAIHEIFEEESLVSYWEKFGTIAFDNAQKAMLTSCYLKTPESSQGPEETIHCCFSFTIRRDSHNIPSMIVGNFLPVDPDKR